MFGDHLSAQGDSRGEYIQLSLIDYDTVTDAQTKRARQLQKRDRGTWLGAARPFVRSWTEGAPPGFVRHVWCEAAQLLAGFEHLRWLGPQLIVSVSAMRKSRRDTEARMAKLPLGELYELDLGANALDDQGITTLAPALQGIRALHLAGNEITAAGFAALGAQVTSLEFLQIGMAVKYRGEERAALLDGIAEAIATTPGFRSLRYLHLYGSGSISPARAKQLHKLPALARISTADGTEWSGLDPESWARRSTANI